MYAVNTMCIRVNNTTFSCARYLSFHYRLSIVCGLDDGAEDWTPPGPVAVSDDVSGVCDEWSVVCVKLARLVTGTVVVRVTDRRQTTLHHTLQTIIHLERACHFVDHLLSFATLPLPTYVATSDASCVVISLS